jgi:MoaA/NifB/PqqE/SkfB family radical SAM enzyme
MFLDVISTPEIGRLDRLQYLYVSLGNLCNARCVYCDVHDSAPPVRPYGAHELRTLLTSAKQLGCTTVHFMGGGEPLLAPQFPAAMELCGELALRVVLTSNGSHLARRLVPMLGRASVEAIIISLDSHVAEVHDDVRGLRSSWSLAVDGLRACRAVADPPKIILNHVVTHRNADHLAAFLSFAGSVGANAVNLIPVKDRLQLQASIAQRRDVAHRLTELRALAQALQIHLLCLDEDVAAWTAPLGSSAARDYRCMFPRVAAYVDLATGGVFPCDCTVHRTPRSTFDLGDIWSQSLAEIWHGEPMRRIRGVLESSCDPGCKRDCDWNNMRTNAQLIAGSRTGGHD